MYYFHISELFLTPNTGRVKNIFAMWLQSIFGENAQTEAWNWKLQISKMKTNWLADLADRAAVRPLERL